MKNVAIAVMLMVVPAVAGAQWLHYPSPGTPRSKDGKPDLAGRCASYCGREAGSLGNLGARTCVDSRTSPSVTRRRQRRDAAIGLGANHEIFSHCFCRFQAGGGAAPASSRQTVGDYSECWLQGRSVLALFSVGNADFRHLSLTEENRADARFDPNAERKRHGLPPDFHRWP